MKKKILSGLSEIEQNKAPIVASPPPEAGVEVPGGILLLVGSGGARI